MLPSRSLRTLWAIAACAIPQLARANDATFGGAGADLVPLSEQRVQMKSEEVVLTARGREWSVEAKYVFFNTARADADVQVGFPEFRCENDGGDCADVAFRDLETTVDGASVKHRQGSLGKEHGWSDFLGVVWLFDVKFPAQREVTIVHRYRLTSGADVEGNSYTSYVTRTGRSWAGPIGHAKFTAVMPPYVRAVYDTSVTGLRSSPPRLLQHEGTPRLELVLEGKDWKPEGGVSFGYNDSQLPLEPLDMTKLPGGKRQEPLFHPQTCEPDGDPAEAQRCLNELYAAKGYPFKNPAIARKYYSGNPQFRRIEAAGSKLWVRDAMALSSFSPSWFGAGEQQQIKLLSELARRAPSSAAAAAPGAQSAEALPAPSPPIRSTDSRPAPLIDTPSARSPMPETPAATKERARESESLQPVAPPASTSKSGLCALSSGARAKTSHGLFALGLVLLALARRRA